MAVLERSELQASPLADLHAIADQLGPRRLSALAQGGADRRDPGRSTKRGRAGCAGGADRPSEDRPGEERGGSGPPVDRPAADAASADHPARRSAGPATTSRGRRRSSAVAGRRTAKGGRCGTREAERTAPPRAPARIAEGVVELLGNGSAFLRVAPPEPSDEDVYISAAQVRRCELVSGDRVSGPVRTPRRSERYPSLVRIDTINGASADTVSEGARYEDLPVAYPSERLALGSEDPTLEAIEWLTPLGRGSRAVIVGAARAGKTETLRRLLAAVSGREDLEVTLVLAGARPEEIAQWQEGPGARRRAQLCRLRRLAGPGGRACRGRRQARGRPRRARAGADRQPRRPAPARRPQGARGRAQPARRRLADRDRHRHAPVRRRDDGDRARRRADLDRPPADPRSAQQRHAQARAARRGGRRPGDHPGARRGAGGRRR